MRYEDFKAGVCCAVQEAGLTDWLTSVEETVDVSGRARTCSLSMASDSIAQDEPYRIWARVCWTWREADAAARHVRVEIELHLGPATGKHAGFPDLSMRADWTVLFMEELTRVFPTRVSEAERSDGEVMDSWIRGPRLEALCGPDGELGLIDMRFDAGQMVDIPPEGECYPVLLDLVSRVGKALHFIRGHCGVLFMLLVD